MTQRTGRVAGKYLLCKYIVPIILEGGKGVETGL